MAVIRIAHTIHRGRIAEQAPPGQVPVIRQIGTREVWEALRQGWEDFLAQPTQLVFLAIIYPVIGLVAARAASDENLMPLVWPLASGFALVGPIAALGIYEISRRREQNLPTGWLNAFDVLRSPNLGAIVILTVMLLAIFVAWLFTAQLIYDSVFQGARPANWDQFTQMLFRTEEGYRLMVLGNAVGLLFAMLVLAVSVVSFPMVLDRPVGPMAAAGTSIRAVMANPVPMGLWGLIVAVLLFAGSILFFVGLAVALPVLGHGTWHLYRKVVRA
ncbi:DUF2189 domain-containing protein [Roseomonas xinghualingensis]|uniref:DUF2189 domain-containing protein n=1 Tax=Roseomonas xinghualingensis TaxID=2986475 RepID=UPI0021F22744|nr:DUF2189 domain-containing protein [Roseomonas sp. SXEYE001]MCV4207653.1 DUF2189 domain-containing protein [Roseomonas sp. SXEYE001]